MYNGKFYCGHCGVYVSVDWLRKNNNDQLIHVECGKKVRIHPRMFVFKNKFLDAVNRGDLLMGVELYDKLKSSRLGGIG
jgi:hypothetical protein